VTIDLFATASNARCARYCSRAHEADAERTDAFTMLDWSASNCPVCGLRHGEVVYAYPPTVPLYPIHLRPLYLIHRDHVVRLLRFSCPPHGACAGFKGRCVICVEFMHNWRDFLGTCLITMGCCRVEDGSDCYSCDWWPDHDADAGTKSIGAPAR
jgi:hypothetical protein